jgi:hypothetical protein
MMDKNKQQTLTEADRVAQQNGATDKDTRIKGRYYKKGQYDILMSDDEGEHWRYSGYSYVPEWAVRL